MSQAPDTSTESALLVPLSTLEAPVLNRVGGKAASLIRLQQVGFNVPHGVVLTTQFFESWIAEIQTTVEWSKATGLLHECGPRKPNLEQRTELSEACDRVKALAGALPLTGDQQALIGAIEPEIGGELQHGGLVAREYGKPCVSSIEDVIARFEDGQIVEVDGDAGVVRFVA
jgi:phosphoenolpyruvate synthase/pyruvate phosphate dikinase